MFTKHFFNALSSLRGLGGFQRAGWPYRLKTATSCFLNVSPHPDRRDVLLKYWLFKMALWVAAMAIMIETSVL